jgi:hypothetical protein
LPSYGVNLIADFVRTKLTLRFSPNFGQNSKKSYRKVKDIKIKLKLIRYQSCKALEKRSLFDLIIAYPFGGKPPKAQEPLLWTN